MQVSARVCTRRRQVRPPTPAAHGAHTPSQASSSRTLTHAHSGASRHSPRSKTVLQGPLRKLSLPRGPTHDRVHRLVHTHVHATVSRAIFEGKKETTGTSTHVCHLRRRQAPRTPVCGTLTHTPTSAHIPAFTPKSPPGSKAQTSERCLSLDTPPALSLHTPTGLHTHAALPTERGVCPHSPPTHRLLLQSHTFPRRNPLSIWTPTHMTSDMSTP